MSYNSPWGDGPNKPDQEKKGFFDIKNPFKSGNGGSFSPKNFNISFDKNLLYIGLGLLGLAMLSTCIYQVKEGEQSIVMRFGKIVRKGHSGLNFCLPRPIESVIITQVDRSRRLEIGYRSDEKENAKYHLESTMVTADENLVMAKADVVYHIENLESYVMHVVEPEKTIKSVVESALREVVSNMKAQSILSDGKQMAVEQTKNLAQEILNNYGVGVVIDMVQLLTTEPPLEVISAYREVQIAKADKEKEINQAQAYNNDKMPKVRGLVSKILSEAETYKVSAVLQANSKVARYNSIYEEYAKADKTAQQSIKYELLSTAREGMLVKTEKLIISKPSVLPHLNLGQESGIKKTSSAKKSPDEESARESTRENANQKPRNNSEDKR